MCCTLLCLLITRLGFSRKNKFVKGRSVFDGRKIYVPLTPSLATFEEVNRSAKGIQERGRGQLSKGRKDDQEEEGL